MLFKSTATRSRSCNSHIFGLQVKISIVYFMRKSRTLSVTKQTTNVMTALKRSRCHRKRSRSTLGRERVLQSAVRQRVRLRCRCVNVLGCVIQEDTCWSCQIPLLEDGVVCGGPTKTRHSRIKRFPRDMEHSSYSAPTLFIHWNFFLVNDLHVRLLLLDGLLLLRQRSFTTFILQFNLQPPSRELHRAFMY